MKRLPATLEELVRRALDAAALKGGDRSEVESDLRAHFEDGLAAGVTETELGGRFGDPEEAGRWIARSRRRHTTDPLVRIANRRSIVAGWWLELRRGARPLVRAPGFAFVVIATLALGVGANTAVFSVLDAVIFDDLPYVEPDRLVRVYEESAREPGETEYMRAPTSLVLREATDVFDGFGTLYTYRETSADLDGDQPERVVTLRVSAGYFETLGIRPAIGRTFDETESFGPGEYGTDDGARVVVLSNGLWRRHFGGERDVLGRSIRLDGAPYEVIGVMPAGFIDPFGSRADVWVPQDLRRGGSNSWGNHYLSAVARLRTGVTLEVAQQRVRGLMASVSETEPRAESHLPRLIPLHDDIVGPTRRPMLWLLVAAAALVLMSACVNIANLVLARGLGREREVALRGALGSGRGRLLVHLLSESVLLALLGGAAGLAVGWVGMNAVLALAPDTLPMVARPTLGLDVFAFALVATIIALAIFAALPALRFIAVSPADVLRSGERSSTQSRGLKRLRNGLVVVQIAVAVVLLSSAGVLVRSLVHLQSMPLGFDGDDVLTFEINLPGTRYADGAARIRLHEQLNARLAALPGVEQTGAVSWLPVNGRYHTWGFYWDPAQAAVENEDAWRNIDVRVFDGDYFSAMDITVLRGAGADVVRREGEGQIWLSRSAAEQIFGDVDPIGQLVGINAAPRWRVAGIVNDVAVDPRGGTARTAYLPHVQFADDRNWPLTQVVRTRGEPAAVVTSARAALAELDPRLVLHRTRTLDDHLASARARDRFATTLMAAFAALAFLLTIVGTYGVLAGSVAGRRREIGIRMALGAGRDSVREMVLRHALNIAVPGLVIGLAGAIAAGRWTRSLLFEVEAADPLVLAGAVALLLAVSLLAGWLPARTAMRVDPARTLTDA